MSAEDLAKWTGRAKPGMPLFDGPSEVRDAFIRAMGIDWTASYIDPAVWINQTRFLIAATETAYLAITRRAPNLCKIEKITVRRPTDHQPMAHAA